MATASGYNAIDSIGQEEEKDRLHAIDLELRHLTKLREDLAMEQRSRERHRQMEKEDMQQRFAADADYINRKRVAIEQELECSSTDLQKLSDSDKDRIKLEIDAIGKDHRMMEKQEKKELEDWMRRVEEDEVYIRRQLDSIDREERLLRRDRKKEEEYLEQQRKRRIKSAYSLQEDIGYTQLRGRSSAGAANSLQQENRAVGDSMQQPSSKEVHYEKPKEQDLKGMTKSELLAQMHKLHSEMLTRNRLESSQNWSQEKLDDLHQSERKTEGVRGGTGFPRSETEQYKRENQLYVNMSQRQSASRDDGNTERKQVEYVTVDATENS